MVPGTCVNRCVHRAAGLHGPCRFCIGCVASGKPNGERPASARGTTGNYKDGGVTPEFTGPSAQHPAGKGRTGHPVIFSIALVCALLISLTAARWSPPSRTRPCIVSSRSVLFAPDSRTDHVLRRRFFYLRQITGIMAGPASGDTAVLSVRPRAGEPQQPQNREGPADLEVCRVRREWPAV